MENQEKRKPSRGKAAVIGLAALLVLSAGGLVGRQIYFAHSASAQTTVTVPVKLAGGQTEEAIAAGGTDASGPGTDSRQADLLELYQGKPEDNRPFSVQDLLPGDTVTRYFCVKAYHDADISLFFRADVTEETKSLGDALHVKITRLESGDTLFDASFSELNGQALSEKLSANEAGETVAYYQIDVSLDTTAGNELQAARLKADFHWYIEGEDEGGLTPPPTGDGVDLVLWITLAASSLLILLAAGRRRKEEKQHG